MIAGNVANAVLEVLFVYGFGWGIEGSAWGTVLAQAGMGTPSSSCSRAPFVPISGHSSR